MNPNLDPISIFLLLSAGGALGGIAEYLRQIVYRGKGLVTNDHELRLRPVIVLVLTSAVIGLSGAMAIQFIFVLLSSFSAANTAKNIIFLFSISVAAGFGSRRILPLLTERLKKQIEGATEKATEAGQKAAEADQKATGIAEKLAVFTRVSASLVPGATASERQWAIEQLTEFLKSTPTSRSVVIPLGRLYRVQKDYQSAIEMFDDFLEHKELANELDKDYADVLYNKACYYALLYSETDEATKKEEFKNASLQSLSRSIEISNENKLDARTDPDFEALRSLSEFTDLVS